MRALFLGQTGIDKKRHLKRLTDLCSSRGVNVDAVMNVGDIMYSESHKAGKPLQKGKILDLPLAELAILRRLAFTGIGYESSRCDNVFVNSHGVFRWNNQLFRAFEMSELEGFQPDIVITLVDDVETIKHRLDTLKTNKSLPGDVSYSLKDLLIWREEEILTADIISSVLKVPHYVLGVSIEPEVSAAPMEVAFNLMFEPWKPRAYVSYPISDAQDNPPIWDKVLEFRRLVRSSLTAFDPMMIGEKRLQKMMAQERSAKGNGGSLVCDVGEDQIELDISEIEEAIPDIDGQIVARDYKLVDQSEVIVAYFPADANDNPLIAAGVQSEIEHATAFTKEVIVVWEASKDPTPFIHQRVDRRFSTLGELREYLAQLGDAKRPDGQLDMPLGSE